MELADILLLEKNSIKHWSYYSQIEMDLKMMLLPMKQH
jgi:hypothetical protein